MAESPDESHTRKIIFFGSGFLVGIGVLIASSLGLVPKNGSGLLASSCLVAALLLEWLLPRKRSDVRLSREGRRIMLQRFAHDTVLIATWILCFWITSRIVTLKELDPKPHDAVKILGLLGVAIVICAKPFGFRKPGSGTHAEITILSLAITVALSLTIALSFF